MLRRFALALRQQHWTGVFIELVIVVLGVFIGLQVSNWNEARRDRAMERQYLERLREDFVLSARRAKDGVEFMESQGRQATGMVASLRACRLDGEASRAEFASALYKLGRIEPPLLTRGTIDELRSTGRLGILRSIQLRQALSNVVEEQERTMEVLGYIVVRRSAPIGYIDARTTILMAQGTGSDGSGAPDEVLFDFPVLCRDPAYINAVSHLGRVSYVLAAQDRRLLKQYDEVVALLDAELARGRP